MHIYSLGLFRFYTLKFENFEFYILKFPFVSKSNPYINGLANMAFKWHAGS